MGFSSGNLPAGLQFLGRMYAEPALIRLTYSYEARDEASESAPKLYAYEKFVSILYLALLTWTFGSNFQISNGSRIKLPKL